MKKYALVCGSAGGLGSVMVDRLLTKGYTVFCCDLSYTDVSNVTQENQIYYQLDITNVEQVDQLARVIMQKTNVLDIIVNCAGVVKLGSLIERDVSYLTHSLSVNLMGMYNVNKAFFSLVERAQGRIVNISSEYGIIDAVPFHTFYTLSKHAVEVYNDGLRREIVQSGVKVVSIRPGAFRTEMQRGIMAQFEELVNTTERYRTPLLKMQKFMVKELKKAKPLSAFARTADKALFSQRPRQHYSVGNSCKMKLLSALPSALQDKIYQIFLQG